MLISCVFTALYAVFCIFLFNYFIERERIKKTKVNIFAVCAATGLLVRVITGYILPGHSTDMGCFSSWADMLYHDGIGAFYESEQFTDYPPGYMYILTLLGYIKNSFTLNQGWINVLIKSPAIICDIITGFFIYKIALKKFSKETAGIIGSIYIFNPAAIINCSAWGQVDSVYLIVVLASLFYLSKQKQLSAYIIFALAVAFKPQALIFSPVFMFDAFYFLYNSKQRSKSIAKIGLSIVAALIFFVIIIIPFGIDNVLSQYIDTLSSYPYASVNAFNIWALIGMNWFELTPLITGIGYIFIVLICVFAGYVFFKIKDESKYYITAAFLCFATYMLSVKMHERYGFCVMAMMLAGFCIRKKRKDYLLYVMFTVSQVINVAWILFVYQQDPSKYFQSAFVYIGSFVNAVIFAYMIFCLIKNTDSKMLIPSQIKECLKTEESAKVVQKDIILITAITAVYSVIALFNLGSMEAPQTGENISPGEETVIEFDQMYDMSKFCLFNGAKPVDENNILKVSLYDENNQLLKTFELDDCEVFAWHFQPVEGLWTKYVKIESEKNTDIKEMAFFDAYNEQINAIAKTAPGIVDEQDTIPDRESYYNSTYFDEIYHARTGYEFVHKTDVYEWTHPPLGKIFIAAGIKIFGMTPFGWRIAGTLFGIIMLPFIYLFAKKMFGKTWLSAIACILFAFDFMHFTQTRIATIDVYITFFVILMYYFMYSYYRMSFYDTKLSKTFIPLLLSGLCFGFGTACKWTGIYAGAGLCVLFFMTIYKRYKEYVVAKERQQTPEAEFIVKNFSGYTVRTFAFCILAFIIIPVVIYLLSYIPYLMCDGGGLGAIIKNQKDMFVYHSKTVLDATHPYSSKWYEWIIMKRPIWYYSGTINENLKEGISAFGNPLVWWVGIPALLFMIYSAAFRKDSKAIFIVTGYFAQLIPWMFVDRVVFIYHYFPCTIFLVLAIVYSIKLLSDKYKIIKKAAYIYTGAVVVLFIMFYPVLSGWAINPVYVDMFLRWFSTWVLM